MNYYIQFLDDFKDGNVLPHEVKRGAEMTVTEIQYKQIVASGCAVDVLGKSVPKSTVQEKSSSRTIRTKVVKKAGNDA